MRDLAWLAGLFGVVANKDLGTGSQCTFHTVGIEQATHDPAEYVPGIDEREVLVRRPNVFEDKASIFGRRLVVHVCIQKNHPSPSLSPLVPRRSLNCELREGEAPAEPLFRRSSAPLARQEARPPKHPTRRISCVGALGCTRWRKRKFEHRRRPAVGIGENDNMVISADTSKLNARFVGECACANEG